MCLLPISLAAAYFHERRGLPGAAIGNLFFAAINPFVVGFWWRRRRREIVIERRAKNLCIECGYDLRATPARCPECGVESKSGS